MGAEYDAKHRFKSKYAKDKFVTDAQYLAEFMCERIAKREKEFLRDNFWDDPKWAKVFVFQVVKANVLLKDYEVGTILKALREPTATKIYSLGAKAILDPIIKKIAKLEQNKVKDQHTNSAESAQFDTRDTSAHPILFPSAKQNLMRDLD